LTVVSERFFGAVACAQRRDALAAISEQFIRAADAAQIPLEVMHRVVAMASGGMAMVLYARRQRQGAR